MTGSFLGTWGTAPQNPTSAGATSNIVPAQPNILAFNLARTYNENFKYSALTTHFGARHLSDLPFPARRSSCENAIGHGLRVGSLAVPLDAVGSYRQNNVAIFDTRVEKRVRFRERYEVGLFFDAFNIGNSNADQNQDNFTGTKTVTVNGQKVAYQEISGSDDGHFAANLPLGRDEILFLGFTA